MKHILLLMSLILTLLTNSCSNENEKATSKDSENTFNTPAELLGTWEINVATIASDPNYSEGNKFGAYIKFNSYNTIEYKDGNFKAITTFKTTIKDVRSENDIITLFTENSPELISCKKSDKFPDQIEFKIEYPEAFPYTNMILIGTRIK